MADVLTQAREKLQGRLDEIHAEEQQLRNALTSLGGGRSSAKNNGANRRKRKAGRQGKAKRAAKGQRLEEVQRALKANPKATTSEIAAQIGISSNQVSALKAKLAKEQKKQTPRTKSKRGAKKASSKPAAKKASPKRPKRKAAKSSSAKAVEK